MGTHNLHFQGLITMLKISCFPWFQWSKGRSYINIIRSIWGNIEEANWGQGVPKCWSMGPCQMLQYWGQNIEVKIILGNLRKHWSNVGYPDFTFDTFESVGWEMERDGIWLNDQKSKLLFNHGTNSVIWKVVTKTSFGNSWPLLGWRRIWKIA